MKNARGFTFLEVLAAMAMMTGAIYLSMRSVETIGSGQAQIRNYSRANNIGLTLMEQLLAGYSSDPKMTAGAHNLFYDGDGNLVTVRPFYTASWTIKLDTPIVKIISIQLQITWNENGHQRVVNFQTFRQS
jgi:prepilin-type N-terminal cleavage/methylation domain-containing protein